ncbi:TetR family transcriptional regulator [Rhizobium sp. KVB221]|uniref:TetR family transcriptional regulator n=1 Tax=Rhizobium setariae TaxID=2801340 RepID=A0A936YPE5_9HYPH|nr:TetR family transcriptional regulator [Rhizobium setariae]MBL0374248.1 TetR family transcriptional regulator [Rhizobium setariae]
MQESRSENLQAARSHAMRQKIIEATHQVIGEKGVPAVTFRSVAQVAGVALGSLSYHFADKNELMLAATEFSKTRFLMRCQVAWQAAEHNGDLAASLAELIEELTVRTRDELVVDYELFLAAFYHPKSRIVSAEWSHETIRDLMRFTSADKANLLAYTFEGLCLHAAKLGKMYFADDVLPLFRIVLDRAP